MAASRQSRTRTQRMAPPGTRGAILDGITVGVGEKSGESEGERPHRGDEREHPEQEHESARETEFALSPSVAKQAVDAHHEEQHERGERGKVPRVQRGEQDACSHCGEAAGRDQRDGYERAVAQELAQPVVEAVRLAVVRRLGLRHRRSMPPHCRGAYAPRRRAASPPASPPGRAAVCKRHSFSYRLRAASPGKDGMAPRARAALLCCLTLALPAPLLAQEDPAEVTFGERLFLETRFAEFFARHATDVNLPLAAGDPVVEQTETTADPLPGPFVGQSQNCRSCHLVDEQLGASGGGMRTYSDFTRRSPVSDRDDEQQTTVRNSPPLVNASLQRRTGQLLHFDGEFATLEALVIATLTGRNFGWRPGEASLARAHIARVIREDDGTGELAQAFGGSYARVLRGRDPTLPAELRLRDSFRLDVERASDDRIVEVVARSIAAYVRALEFETDETGAFAGSPFDRFLELNGLPRHPRHAESDEDYSDRLRSQLELKRSPRYVEDGPFAFHEQERRFGPVELAGLRVFLRKPPKTGIGPNELLTGGIGNCLSCHPPPAFSDFRLHNTGVSQLEYDAVHGEEAFAALEVPDLTTRGLDPERWLPATEQHPDAREPLRAVPSAEHPEHADLGVWNTFGNSDFPAPQRRLRRLLCSRVPRCSPEVALQKAFAAFKTPGLRDLSHSAPYLHDGGSDTLEDVIQVYREASDLARAGALRNGSPEMAGISLTVHDVAPLAAFLRSLNEDYE